MVNRITQNNPSPETGSPRKEKSIPLLQKDICGRSSELIDKSKVYGPSGMIVSLENLPTDESRFRRRRLGEDVFLFDFPVYVFGIDDGVNTTESRNRQYHFLKKYLTILLKDEFEESIGNNYLSFIVAIKELLKNAVDHSPGRAYFGMRITITPKNVILQFIVADEGAGIHESIKNNVGNIGFSEAYEIAASNFSTSMNAGNCGAGLADLPGIAKCLDMNIVAFDNGMEFSFNNSNNPFCTLDKSLFTLDPSIRFYYLGSLAIKRS